MVNSLIKFGVRSMIRQRMYTVINILGLVVGFCAFIMIMLYVRHERSFDRFFQDGDQVYRLISHSKERSAAITPYIWGNYLKEEFAEITELASINFFPMSVRNGDQVFSEPDVIVADSTLFSVLNFPVVAGDQTQFLKDPNKLLITPEVATRYFGDVDPIGELIEIDIQGEFLTYEVQGIIESPRNSHLRFNLILPIHHYQHHPNNVNAFNHWRIHFIYTYLKMPGGVDRGELKKKFKEFLYRHAGQEAMDAYQPDIEPLEDIYLKSDLQFDFNPRGDESNLKILVVVAIGILLMAIINFINISSAQSLRRAREVGIRKVFGSQRWSLLFQFVAESSMLSMISAIMALLLATSLLPYFNTLAQKEFVTGDILNLQTSLTVLSLGVGLGLVAGIYPALILSSYRPISVLRSRGAGKARGAMARKALVVLQFTLAVILILSTGVIYKQVVYMNNKPLGFNKEQTLSINGAGPVAQSASRTDLFRQALLRDQNISSVSAASAPLGGQTYAMRFTPTGYEGMESPSLATIFSDHDFAKTYDLQIVQGRFFDRSIPTDSGALIINESALKLFAEQDATWLTDLGSKKMSWTSFAGHSGESRVIGVVEDFNFESLKSEITPLVFKMEPWFFYSIQVKMEVNDIASTLAGIRSSWQQLFPEVPFEYEFVDEQFSRHFEQDRQLGSLLGVFAIVSLVIGILGLFGLASFLAIEKEREMSIRKVTGASPFEILKQLSWVFLKLVLLANLLAMSLGFLLMEQWLNGFAFRVKLPVGIYVAAVASSLIVTVITVGYHALRLAHVNPAKILGRER